MYAGFITVIATGALILGALTGEAQTVSRPLLADELNTIQVFRQASPGVVQIDARLTASSPFDTSSVAESTGTGFVIDKEGHILTAFHVVKDKDEIVVTLSNRKHFDARLVGTAPQLDIALLQIDASPADLVGASAGQLGNLAGWTKSAGHRQRCWSA